MQICFARDVWQAHTDLLVTCGAQLKNVGSSISSGPFPPELVEKVISECPNVRCTLSSDSPRDDFDSIMVRAMADHVDSISGKFSKCNSFEVLRSCQKVEKLNTLIYEKQTILCA